MDVQISGLKSNIIAACQLTGIPESDFLRELDLTKQSLNDNHKYVHWEKGAQVLSLAFHWSGDRKIGIRMGQLNQLQMLGNELSNLIANSPDFLTAMRNFCTFSRIIGAMFNFSFKVTDKTCSISFMGMPEWKNLYPMSYQLSTEINMTTIYTLVKQLSQDRVIPCRFEFEYKLDSEIKQAFKDMIDIPILDNKKVNLVEFYKIDLELKNPNYSEAYYTPAFSEAMYRLKQVENLSDISEKVKLEIKNILQDPNTSIRASLEEVAARLSKSARTLQRELKKVGMVFEDLKTEISKEIIDRFITSRTNPEATELAEKIKLSLTAFREWYKRNYGKEYGIG